MAVNDKQITCKYLYNAVDWMHEQESSGYRGKYSVKRENGLWQVKKSLTK